MEAKTIHPLLEVDPKGGGFKRGDDNPLDCDLLVIDETSMVDVMLMQSLMKAVPNRAALLIVGDIDQLSSVGPGQSEVQVYLNEVEQDRLAEAAMVKRAAGSNRAQAVTNVYGKGD